MRKRLAMSALVATITAAATGSLVVAAGDLAVTVSYSGKGKVDDTHEILVFLFDHPNPTAESIPLAMQQVYKSGATATFSNVSADTVYVVMVYDEQANYDGRSGPPPHGAPIATYGKGGKPIAVKPGPNAKVTASFDDSRRWGQ
jgi:hypothetical protein